MVLGRQAGYLRCGSSSTNFLLSNGGSRASRHAGFQQPLACQDASRSSAEATSVAALNATAIATASAISAAATVAIARATAMATVTGKTVTSPAKTH